MNVKLKALVGGALMALAVQNASAYTVVGNGGVISSNGVVTNSPLGNSSYGYVSTAGGVSGNTKAGIGGTDGSTLVTDSFTAVAGDVLNFYFNYVTSDGASFADYAWVDLLNAGDSSIAGSLFTARTTPGGDTVPGFGMPAVNAALLPASTPIIGGAPTWSALAGDSGRCWDTGCGYTGWINAKYTIASAGTYMLKLGVANWSDTAFDSGLAFDGITVGGKPVDPDLNAVPLPAALPLMISGLGLLGFASRRRKESV